MSARSESPASLSIARHTVQFMLHAAIDAASDHCFGIIGCRNPSLIDHAAALKKSSRTPTFAELLAGNSDLQHTVEVWQETGALPCGTYFRSDAEVPDAGQLAGMESALRERFPELRTKPLVHIALKLNMAGCLEAFAYRCTGNSLRPIPLLLEEDGQGSEKR